MNKAATRKSPVRRATKKPEDSAAANPSSAHFCIAGIGASAGGLEAICQLFAAMPTDSNVAFVVVQHLYPTQKSLAAEIIGKHTAIPASNAEDGMRLVPGHIYTVPPNVYPSLRDGRLRLEPPDNATGPRLPIDHFLASLGDDQHERAIGVILSGSGSDGSLGLKRIEANGGIVLAQQPETAQFGSMPHSAIETGLVHCVLPVADMPDYICRYARHDYVLQAKPATDEEAVPAGLAGILDLLQQRVDFDFAGYRRNTLVRRIRRRMGLRSINELADYAAVLNADAQEVDVLFKDLLISVTEFFRDPEAWQDLAALAIKPLVDGKEPGDPIRIWVPGCASGEEAYTMAMLVLEQLRKAGKRCPLLVFATDVNEHSLQLARTGIYPSGITTRIRADCLRRYFVESANDHHYQVSKSLRDVVVFGQQNLLSDPPFTRVDLICCRNLMIYLEADVQIKVIALFRFALQPSAYLFLGSAEAVGKHASAFTEVSKKWRIFQHTGGYLPGDAELPID
ncbi:MAG: chemotaxis protein CheB, partial [Propionivibrio sp.]